jgi:hypothetical protein
MSGISACIRAAEPGSGKSKNKQHRVNFEEFATPPVRSHSRQRHCLRILQSLFIAIREAAEPMKDHRRACGLKRFLDGSAPLGGCVSAANRESGFRKPVSRFYVIKMLFAAGIRKMKNLVS